MTGFLSHPAEPTRQELRAVAATPDSTIDALLRRSKRRSNDFPIAKTFLQQGRGRTRTPGPLAAIVRRGDERALDLYLLAHAVATSEPYDITEAANVWARTLDLGHSDASRSAVSKAWRRLAEHKLVSRSRNGRQLQVTFLADDGSGDPYEHPNKAASLYLKLPFAYWTDGWHRKLTLPGKALLLIALSLADDFPLPSERGPDWYGISADTVQAGFKELRKHGLISVRQMAKEAPLAPDGYTVENRYTLREPFGPRGVRAKDAR